MGLSPVGTPRVAVHYSPVPSAKVGESQDLVQPASQASPPVHRPAFTHQLRKHLLQLVHIHKNGIFCLGLPHRTDCCFCSEKLEKWGMLGDLKPRPTGPQPEPVPPPTSTGSPQNQAVAPDQQAQETKFRSPGPCGKQENMSWFSCWKNKRNPGHCTLEGAWALGSPTTKIFSSSAMSCSESPLTARQGEEVMWDPRPLSWLGPPDATHPPQGLGPAELWERYRRMGTPFPPAPHPHLWSCHP
ncbi:hypothetical protein P7K49_012136 [Saguinus oedipus]|uniref:Uncharacterized protein n=1 Tax=Saguinus oedipus TaxID=9490 RepID=A0ABQ9VU76_SAGOE|nr:hypothetical protein P7K49_012136 [Saguinus oedipus]